MADCSNPGEWAGCIVGGAVDKAIDSGAQGLGEEMMGAWDSLMKGFLTSWLDSGMLVSLDGASMQWLTGSCR